MQIGNKNLDANDDERPFTREEVTELFGDEMYVEAMNLVWNSPGTRTVGQIRAEFRKKARSRNVGKYHGA